MTHSKSNNLSISGVHFTVTISLNTLQIFHKSAIRTLGTAPPPPPPKVKI